VATFYHNDFAMRNTADATGGKPIAVGLQSICVSAINILVAIYEIHGRKGQALFYFFYTGHHAGQEPNSIH
jgi:hypothetical protein